MNANRFIRRPFFRCAINSRPRNSTDVVENLACAILCESALLALLGSRPMVCSRKGACVDTLTDCSFGKFYVSQALIDREIPGTET
jgi:hypothetical protein